MYTSLCLGKLNERSASMLDVEIHAKAYEDVIQPDITQLCDIMSLEG